MTALLLTLLAQAPLHVRLERSGPGCYRADDHAAGWKQVVVPTDALALAAPPEIDQFRSGEQVLVFTAREVFSYSHQRPRWGVATLTFDVPPETRVLRVRFAQRLDGMRVEVKGGDGSGRNTPLAPERRYVGDELDLEWGAEGVRAVTLVLHHHVREAPVVAQWSSARWEEAPAAVPPRLSYLQPAGRAVPLCDSPRVRLELRSPAPRRVSR